ncbi:hypothetical protein N7G274_007219 [Stereocaulon virgatum]|uniref:Ubiquitin-like domain-containing protein n=1 Tax=Stereocaulon virgatum TaxID=373712 RepID=A0ABR4A2T7_9LECA
MTSAKAPPPAAVNDTIRDATSMRDVPAQDLDSATTNLPSSMPAEMDNINQQATANNATRSLFGPFPPSNTNASTEAEPRSTARSQPSTTTDQIELSQENKQSTQRLFIPASNDNQPSRDPLAPVQTNKSSGPGQPSPPPLTREQTFPAIGPATDKPTPVPKESEIEGPVLFITLLLSSTGARHPYKLDEKYLKKRNVVVEGNNPINLSLYKLKELILRDWRDEWESRPSSPESIRLISMGKMLNDKTRLSDAGFTNGVTPHIIHMTIKPQDIVDEEDAKIKSGAKDRDGNERSPGCRCVIQ